MKTKSILTQVRINLQSLLADLKDRLKDYSLDLYWEIEEWEMENERGFIAWIKRVQYRTYYEAVEYFLKLVLWLLLWLSPELRKLRKEIQKNGGRFIIAPSPLDLEIIP